VSGEPVESGRQKKSRVSQKFLENEYHSQAVVTVHPSRRFSIQWSKPLIDSHMRCDNHRDNFYIMPRNKESGLEISRLRRSTDLDCEFPASISPSFDQEEINLHYSHSL
jgi:hypothetical protein